MSLSLPKKTPSGVDITVNTTLVESFFQNEPLSPTYVKFLEELIGKALEDVVEADLMCLIVTSHSSDSNPNVSNNAYTITCDNDPKLPGALSYYYRNHPGTFLGLGYAHWGDDVFFIVVDSRTSNRYVVFIVDTHSTDSYYFSATALIARLW